MTDRGCYGLPSVYSHTAKTCGSCAARDDCKSKAFTVLQMIRGTVMVDDLIRSFQLSYAAPESIGKTLTITPAQHARLILAPSKIAGRLERLFLQGFDKIARMAFLQRQNPFPQKGAKHLHLAGELLLQGAVTKAGFREACIERFGWSTGTAASEVSNAVALLSGLNLVIESRTTMELRK